MTILVKHYSGTAVYRNSFAGEALEEVFLST